MDKNFKLFVGRGSLIGDTIMFLPVLNYLELLYPNSYKIFPISKKTCQSAPLFINHPLIDKIHILEEWESVDGKDMQLANSCDARINPFPQHPDGPPGTNVNSFWWNKYNCVEETWRMAGIDINEINILSELERKPKLEIWFPVEKREKTIGIWCMAGYGNEPKRSPTKEYWINLIKLLIRKGYTIIRFGHEKEPTFYFNDYSEIGMDKFYDVRHLPFFEQIKASLGCIICINTDSGSGWVLGAYGHPQISLLTNHAPNHTENLLAFAPENWKNNNINLRHPESCDMICQLEIANTINEF